ncbi:hypothetical protein EGR_10844 [Echinococcus granulosus]|uniref:Uncharacterized protein n=1 Tax=Echinococcus granulosus TaxID=6210 RepID=W6TZW3_ECHGR|nr:hypothetical protein EGR_10844 [Echinococcus granulosus]EUB54293.1 hypothetical protein EGR_10844 [Echinococcus granulosus]
MDSIKNYIKRLSRNSWKKTLQQLRHKRYNNNSRIETHFYLGTEQGNNIAQFQTLCSSDISRSLLDTSQKRN